MRVLRSSLMVLVSTGVLASGASGSAAAQGAASGAGAMRCTVVIGRLSSPSPADRMVVLSWVQGYLSGVVSAQSAFAPTRTAAEVPEYDVLGPRVLTLCKADPTSDLHHVAGRFFAALPANR